MLSFLKSEKDQEIARIKKEIKNTEFKKSSMISAVVGEKTELDQQISICFGKIGSDAYTLHKSGSSSYDFSAIFAQIEALDTQMAEKDVKIAEITARYDEEISLLSATVPTGEVATPASAPFCEKCGTQSSLGDAFCQNCGNKMG